MQSFAVPLCYFPSLVLFVDNGHDFLLNAMLQLNEQIAYRLFDSPMEALDFVGNYRMNYEVIHRHCLSEYRAAQQVSNDEVDIRLAALHAEVYNPYRFSELSVLVVDFKTRGMSGLNFYERVSNTAIKKLLLVSAEEESQAIEALENGIIDAYLCKQDKNFLELMNKNILALQLNYFLNMSNGVRKILNLDFSVRLYHKNFAAVFNQIKEKYRIIEYYLIDHSGSFLMLDEDARLSIFMVKHEKDLPQYYERIKPLDLNEPHHIYAYAPYQGQFLLHHHKILSYHRYLDELDAEELLVS